MKLLNRIKIYFFFSQNYPEAKETSGELQRNHNCFLIFRYYHFFIPIHPIWYLVFLFFSLYLTFPATSISAI
jgi:hypothetical protein